MSSQSECIERRCYLEFLVSKYMYTEKEEKNANIQLTKSNTVPVIRITSESRECTQLDQSDTFAANTLFYVPFGANIAKK